MGRIIFFFQEALRAMRRNGAPSVAAIITTVVTVVLLGVLIPIFQTTQAKSERSPRRAQHPGRSLPRRDPGRTRRAARTSCAALPDVAKVEFITKSEGAGRTARNARRRESRRTDLAAARKPAAGELPDHPRRRLQPAGDQKRR